MSYKGETFTRNAANGADLLAPHITNPLTGDRAGPGQLHRLRRPPSTALRSPRPAGTSFPWAIRSRNLTYVGEVPFSYIVATDRYVAFSDLLFPALDPTARRPTWRWSGWRTSTPRPTRPRS